ncbi:ABC transporter permease subunit [Halorussus halophilus]|uniref:ABC transporter permease subunit n=1 Tax=Halorussus halophilus TaxID=2650975 RepID=UPI001300EBE8|nr:ABC transporter permease subunit [Halorussus halophilus]
MKLRKTLRIARWEVTKNSGQIDRRTLVAVGVLLAIVAGLVPLVASQGVTLDDGIYKVAVSEESPYYDPVRADGTFVAVEPSVDALRSDQVDIFVCPERMGNCPPGRVSWDDDPKGRAALSEFRKTVEWYNDELMRHEADEAAAFPVNVSLRYVEQNASAFSGASGGSGAGDPSQVTTRTPGEGETGLGGGSGDDGTNNGDGRQTQSGTGTGGNGDSENPPPTVGSESASIFGDDSKSNTPSSISPPFPFESLVLAFAFVLPMNFVIQAYASSVIDERINDRGELLLVSPVSRGDIIAGKTLPYFVGMVGIATVTAVGVTMLTPVADGGALAVASTAFLSVSAVVPIALVFLACAFVGAMFARSFKELTFVTVSLSVFLTAYAFIPAIFTDVHPIAAISPLTLVVRALRGSGVPLAEYAFSTLPLYLTAGMLFALGAGVYREEDMFTQRPVPLKALDALDSQISGKWSVAKLSALSIPFVLVGELLAVASLYALPVELSIPLLLLAIAPIEEVAKSAPIYAGFAHSRFERSGKMVLVLGFLSGLGFFLGEKATAVVQVVGLQDLDVGRAAFLSGTGIGVETSPLVLAGLLFAPLALHTVTTTVTAYGASKDKYWYGVALVTATLVHAAYNLTVVNALG